MEKSKVRLNIKKGKKDGIYKLYIENGNLKYETNFKNGKIEGIFKEYHENGNISVEANIKNEKKMEYIKNIMKMEI